MHFTRKISYKLNQFKMNRLYSSLFEANSKIFEDSNQRMKAKFGDVRFDDIVKKHQEILSKINIDDSFFAGNDKNSFNYYFFCFLKLKGFKPKNILEIGTYFGVTTKYLSELFPEAVIYSVEISKSHPRYDVFYGGKEKAEEREKILKNNTDRANIKVIRDTSSAILTHELPELDLVWLDGDHRSPFVFLDIYNSYHLLGKNKAGKYIVLDDIFIKDQMIEYIRSGAVGHEVDGYEDLVRFLEDKNLQANYYPRYSKDQFVKWPRHIGVIEF